jgi:peptide/nickel transport system substrate-binding protein
MFAVAVRIAAIAVITALLALPGAATAQKSASVLRVIPHSNLAILDPIWTTAYMSRNHGSDLHRCSAPTRRRRSSADGRRVGVSPDNRLHGRSAAEGTGPRRQAVTGEDVTASLTRWSARSLG